MCFHYAYIADQIETGNRFNIDNLPDFDKIYHANAFSNLSMPVITNEEPNELNFHNWGLIPFWAKAKKDADSIRQKTANARSETIFKKPSFKYSIVKKRCLVPATGFFEWRHEGKEKIPHFINVKEHNIFCFAGIWEKWTDKQTGEVVSTYSIITTQANELMSHIHNKNKRMPVILKKEDEMLWLSDLKKDEIEHLLYQFPSNKMGFKVIDNKNLWEWMENHE